MPLHKSASAAQALFRVFVLPTLSKPPAHRSTNAASRAVYPRISNTRSFSSTPTSKRAVKVRKAEPEPRTEKWDEEITAKVIYLVNPETNTVLDPETNALPPPRTRFDILSKLDRNTHRLVQLPSHVEGIPVCKIVNKKQVYEHEKRRKQEAKEKKKVEAASKSLKTLELNWAMDQNDLGHRLDRITEFLSEGRKVEVILASKKRGRKASPEECANVLQRIRKTVEGVEGAKEAKSMEGKVGGFATLFFQGRPQHQAA